MRTITIVINAETMTLPADNFPIRDLPESQRIEWTRRLLEQAIQRTGAEIVSMEAQNENKI